MEYGRLVHTNGSLTTSGTFTLAEGICEEASPVQLFGPLQLDSGDSALSLLGTTTALKFANSSGMVWSNAATLAIEHWNGSVTGGGMHQVTFGNNSAGLTAQQLSQIYFHNPESVSGDFPAAILATGEIVPARFLSFGTSSASMVLTWGPGATLQTATNVIGLYENLAATSPYTVPFIDSQRFFRLKQ